MSNNILDDLVTEIKRLEQENKIFRLMTEHMSQELYQDAYDRQTEDIWNKSYKAAESAVTKQKEIPSAQTIVMKSLDRGNHTRQEICSDTQLSFSQIHGSLVGLANSGKVVLVAGQWFKRRQEIE